MAHHTCFKIVSSMLILGIETGLLHVVILQGRGRCDTFFVSIRHTFVLIWEIIFFIYTCLEF
jgi:hypothetical protein